MCYCWEKYFWWLRRFKNLRSTTCRRVCKHRRKYYRKCDVIYRYLHIELIWRLLMVQYLQKQCYYEMDYSFYSFYWLDSLEIWLDHNFTRSGMTPVRRTYVVWGLYVNRGSAYVDLGSFSWHILSHQVNSDIIIVSCLMIGCQWDSDDNKIYVILTQPFGIPVHMQGFPSCWKSGQSHGKAYLLSQM